MKYVDLFAGCGGLSLGLDRAGFELVLAIEKSDMATETFYHNFIERIDNEDKWNKYKLSSIDEQVKTGLLTNEVGAILARDDLMQQVKEQGIDIVVGGPPCQGFSLAGRRNPDDARNKLPWQFLEFVEKTDPKAVVIENVVGMSRGFKKEGKEAPFEQLQEALRSIGRGYVVQPIHINAMHYGVPEHRPRLMILGLRKDIADAKGITSDGVLWHSNFKDLIDTTKLPGLAPLPVVNANEVRTAKDAISDLSEVANTETGPVAKAFLKEMRNAKAWKLKPLASGSVPNQNQRNHQDKARARFRLYQYLMSQGLSPNTLNIPAKEAEVVAREKLLKLLADVRLPAYAPDGTVLARTLEELIELLFELKTKKHSQRPLSWSKPSPTVVTLPDDYVHPSEPRIFTVRELARFQSFPDAFEFRAKETTGSERRRIEVPQYSQVGNAVAPLVAYAVGKKFKDILTE